MALVTLTTADVGFLDGAIVRNAVAGGTLGVGDLVFLAADGDWEEADASIVATARALGVVTGTDDGDLTVSAGDGIEVTIFGQVVGFSGMAEGEIHFVSDTAGRLDTVSGTVTFRFGYAVTADVFFILPGISAESS